jgi:hypothetical protein
MARYEISGLFNRKPAIKIMDKMRGKSYMEFEFVWTIYANQCSITVVTDYDCTDEELRDMFIYCALNELAELSN